MFTHLDLPLYALDHDMTYDLVYAANIHHNIFNFLNQIPNFPVAGFLNDNLGSEFLMLFDRRTPDGYPWAERYSTLIYEFLKEFTTTGQYDHFRFSGNRLTYFYYFNGKYHETRNEINGHFDYEFLLGDRLEYKLSHPQNYFYFHLDFSEKVITNTTDKPVYLTYFTSAFAEGNYDGRVAINYNEERNVGVSTPFLGKVYNKIAVRIAPKASFVIDKYCALGSVMISNLDGSRNEALEKTLPNYYRYDQLEEFLIIFWDEIRDGFKRMGQYASHLHFIESFQPTITQAVLKPTVPNPSDGNPDHYAPVCSTSTGRNISTFSRLNYHSNYNSSYTSIGFSNVPNWYRFASLIYGDPDIPNRGKAIKIVVVDNQVQFRLWDWEKEKGRLFGYKSFLLPNNDEFLSFSGLVAREWDSFYSSFYDITCDYILKETYTGAIGYSFPHFEPYIQFEPNYYEVTKAFIDGQFSRLNALLESENTNMPDSQRVKEIHQALQASKFAYYEKDGQTLPRVANLGYYIERIGRILGISVNPDGGIRSIRQSKHIPQGQDIPAGWAIGQWGRNDGGDDKGQKGGSSTEERDGIAYEVIGNRFATNPYTGEPSKIEEGGYVLCENLPQYLEILKDDFDKCLGLQPAAANALPSADGKNHITYEGLHTLVAELAYMQSAMSEKILQTWISSISTQSMSQEILGAFGVPIEVKEIIVRTSLGNYQIPYPGLAEDAPTNFNLISLVLHNIAPILLAITKLAVSNQPEEFKDTNELQPELKVDGLSKIYDLVAKKIETKQR